MAATITFSATAKYGYGGKQYIARIRGRDQKFTFSREFVGTKGGKRREDAEHITDECGLYVECDIDRKGNKDETYSYVLPARSGDGLVKQTIDKEDAMAVARELDAGHDIASCPTILRVRQALWDKADAKKSAKEAEDQAKLTEAAAYPEAQPTLVPPPAQQAEVFDPCL